MNPATRTPVMAVLVSDEAPSNDVEPSSCSDPGGSATTMVGVDTTVTPSAAEAVAAVPRLEESVVCMAAGVVEAGTAMVAVMSTLAAATVTVTAEASTPATSAIELRRAVVSAYSLRLPLAIIVRTTGGGGGGAAGVPGGRGGALAGAGGDDGSDGQAQQLSPMGRRP